jgi:hypothetical protein
MMSGPYRDAAGRDEISVSKAKRKDLEVDRKEFDAVLSKLIASPPTTKAKIIGKIKTKSRLRPLTRPLLQK